MPQRSLRNNRLYITDGSTNPWDEGGNKVEVVVGDGNITWTEDREIEWRFDRGRIIDTTGEGASLKDVVVGRAIDGNESPMDLSFDIRFDYYVSTSSPDPIGPVQALKGGAPVDAGNVARYEDNSQRNAGAWNLAGWDNADTIDICAPWAVNIWIEFDPECVTDDPDAAVEYLKFPVFRVESLGYDLDTGQIAVSGQCQALHPSKESPE